MKQLLLALVAAGSLGAGSAPPFALLAAPPATTAPGADETPFARALRTAEEALERGAAAHALPWIQRALERDPRSRAAWDARARWAQLAQDQDELAWSLFRLMELAQAQGVEGAELRALRERQVAADPLASEFESLRNVFLDRLMPLAQAYEKDRRPHSAIAVFREVLAIDPQNAEALAAIERISSLPDPSLAEDAKSADLFADVSDEWIRDHDEKHREWGDRAKLKTEYYTVYTDAGYRVLLQAATAMDQMHVFYKRFFGVDGSVARIDLNIFKTREEYLKKGQGPPVEWSGGHFTGSAVEVYVDRGGFQETLNTLFHEAAHQFVSIATSASGWLNEGLASFFEGTRLLPNGTVLMNLPADHRLFPLADRLERGWMRDEKDGIDPQDKNRTPDRAPTFEMVLENRYEWGPPWYAPTWGVVYWAYNYQDPVDGRFLYRKAFREFMNKSGGRTGGSAIANFVDVVLASPEPPSPGATTGAELPATGADLNRVWKDWILALRDEKLGKRKVERPYAEWGRWAIKRKDWDVAAEHFEKGLAETPNDPELLVDFGELLAGQLKNPDRGAKLALAALRALEREDAPDRAMLGRAERLLAKADPERESLERVHEDLWSAARGLVQRYASAERWLMTMELSYRLTEELRVPGLLQYYEQAWRKSGKTLHLWKLAYNERDLEGWSSGTDTPYVPNGEVLEAANGTWRPEDFSYVTLPMDFVTKGDYSLEADLLAPQGKVGFGGLVFGMKSGSSFNALVYLPGKGSDGALAGSAFLDLSTFTGAAPRIMRHVPVVDPKAKSQSKAEDWTKLRIDVTGRTADVWVDGELKLSHEFASRESVSGSLGLIVGPGEARFRNVRYLARTQGDPGSALERSVRMEAYGDEEQSVGGSWLGKSAPFPTVQRWLRGERKSWREAGPVPQLLVMWSIRQNDLIAIDGWLGHLKQRYADVGLEIVCIASVEDTAAIDAYATKHPFPGAVGLDGDEEVLGDTFHAYRVDLFNLPRLILLDIDGKVVWEGDPGLRVGQRWLPGIPTYLDDPLEELVTRRKLRELALWRASWKERAVPALREADFREAKPILEAASAFQAKGDDDVFAAQACMASVRSALEALESTADSLEREGGAAALEVLVGWAPLVDVEVGKDARKILKSALASDTAKAWSAALEAVKLHPRRIKKEGAEAALEGLRADLAAQPGRFPALLLERLEGVEPDGVRDALDGAERIPELWLAREYFKW